MVWCVQLFGLAGATIEKKSGGGEGFNPERNGHGGMDEKNTYAVVESPEDAFDLAVLRGCIWTREAKDGAGRGVERAERVVVKLAAVVSLKSKNTTTKLCLNVGMEMLDRGSDLGFFTHGKCPNKVSIIIK